MRSLTIALLLFLSGLTSTMAQQPSGLIAANIPWCDANFPDELIPPLQKEFDKLEKHFIEKGLLDDSSAQSYYRVYQEIAREGDLAFISSQTSKLLDSLDHELIHRCFYKLLTQPQLSQLTDRHLEAENNIAAALEDDMITPGTLAQRIIDYRRVEDFNLRFYRTASLLAFYRLTLPSSFQKILEAPGREDFAVQQILHIQLNDEDEILIAGEPKNPAQVREIISAFLQEDPFEKAIEIYASHGASYESFHQLQAMAYAPYDSLRSELASEKYASPYSELTAEQKLKINRLAPRNVLFRK